MDSSGTRVWEKRVGQTVWEVGIFHVFVGIFLGIAVCWCWKPNSNLKLRAVKKSQGGGTHGKSRQASRVTDK